MGKIKIIRDNNPKTINPEKHKDFNKLLKDLELKRNGNATKS